MHIHSNTSTWGQSFISKQIYTQLDSILWLIFTLIDALFNSLASNIALLTTFMINFIKTLKMSFFDHKMLTKIINHVLIGGKQQIFDILTTFLALFSKINNRKSTIL